MITGKAVVKKSHKGECGSGQGDVEQRIEHPPVRDGGKLIGDQPEQARPCANGEDNTRHYGADLRGVEGIDASGGGWLGRCHAGNYTWGWEGVTRWSDERRATSGEHPLPLTPYAPPNYGGWGEG